LLSLSVFIMYFLPYNIHAQNISYVPGELIIQTDGSSFESVLARTFSGSRAQAPVRSTSLSHDLGLHVLQFDADEISDSDMLSRLRANPHVLAVQRNHYLQSRRRPAEPRFNEQWPLRRSTVTDADIDMEAAWDRSAGG